VPQSADLWYAYTATATGNAVVDTCAPGGTIFDTVITAYDAALGCPTPGSPFLGCNDQACGGRSLLILPVVVGQTYLIQVGGWFGQIGSATLTIDIPPRS
jgi:hypothetical protein